MAGSSSTFVSGALRLGPAPPPQGRERRRGRGAAAVVRAEAARLESRGRAVLLTLSGAAAAAAIILTAAAAAFAAAAADLDPCDVEIRQEFFGADLNTVITIACVAEAVAFTGAFVGGVSARKRKAEVERVNAQLRQINVSLRKQARVESYAPGLSYAPVGTTAGGMGGGMGGGGGGGGGGRVTTLEPPPVQVDVGKEELLRLLKGGKRCLREHDLRGAEREFEAALRLAGELGDSMEEKKAARGLGASKQRQGKYEEAIKYHKMVLAKSAATGEHSGDTDAYGAIADCYTEIGDITCAAKYYDRYIERLDMGDEGGDV